MTFHAPHIAFGAAVVLSGFVHFMFNALASVGKKLKMSVNRRAPRFSPFDGMSARTWPASPRGTFKLLFDKG